jgi:hypothetical protein
LLRQSISIFSSLSLILSSLQPVCLAQDDNSIDVRASSTGTVNNSPANSNTKSTSKTPMLYGRIEQLAARTGAQFPVLKEQTAQLDKRLAPGSVQKGQANAYSGTVVRAFPQQFDGTWGGHLKIWTSQMDAICWQLDSDEANRTRQLMIPGREGSVNFYFQQSTAGIKLEPAQVIFMVPMKDTNMQQELNGLLGAGGSGQAGGLTLPGMDNKQMANVIQQMTNTMTVPIMVSFGTIDRPDIKGISGNEIKAVVLRNTIRQLSPSVLEEQIVSQETQRNKNTGKVRQEFAETVVRFTSQNANTLYVQAAAVNYTSDRKFERKLILYGTVRKGQVMPESMNPMGNMMPGNQLPQLPGGQNPFQGLMPNQ